MERGERREQSAEWKEERREKREEIRVGRYMEACIMLALFSCSCLPRTSDQLGRSMFNHHLHYIRVCQQFLSALKTQLKQAVPFFFHQA